MSGRVYPRVWDMEGGENHFSRVSNRKGKTCFNYFQPRLTRIVRRLSGWIQQFSTTFASQSGTKRGLKRDLVHSDEVCLKTFLYLFEDLWGGCTCDQFAIKMKVNEFYAC